MITLMPSATAEAVVDLSVSTRSPRSALRRASALAARLAASSRFVFVEVVEEPDDLNGPDPEEYEVALLAVLAESERSFWLSWRVPRHPSFGKRGKVFGAVDGVGACPVEIAATLIRYVPGLSARSA